MRQISPVQHLFPLPLRSAADVPLVRCPFTIRLSKGLSRWLLACAVALAPSSADAVELLTAAAGDSPQETPVTDAGAEPAPEPPGVAASTASRVSGLAADPFDVPLAAPTDPPFSAAERFSRGERLWRLGQHAAAVAALRATVRADAGHIRAHEGLRRAASHFGRADRAADHSAVLVLLYHQAFNGGMAHQRFQDLLALDPQHPRAGELRGVLGLAEKAPDPPTTIGDRLRSLFGIVVFLGILLLMSNNRRKVSLRIVFWGLGLQLLFGCFILLTPVGTVVFQAAQDVVNTVLSYTDDAQKFLFGPVYGTFGSSAGPAQYVDGVSGDLVAFGVTFIFHILPTIVFFGALMSVLYHVGVVQLVVRAVAWGMQRVMGTSGAESLSAAGNIFVGQTEAPLLIRPYVGQMTMSELMAVMCGGFATVAGGVLAAYVRFGVSAGHLLAASVMSAPAALVAAKIMYPETTKSETSGGATKKIEKTTTNIVDAAAAGAADGMKLAINVAAMLLAFMALIAMVDGVLGYVSSSFVDGGLTLSRIFGTVFTPLAWCMGVSSQDLSAFGNLLGTKIAINEFVAYVQLGALQNQMTERSFTIATYALCGFANFSSIGIQIGGISGIAPGRRSDLARIGLKAMVGGAFASWMTACVAGIFL